MNIIYTVLDAALAVLALLMSVLPHEIAHGYTAYLLGDNTAKYMGRLSINPLKHINERYAALILGGMFVAKLFSNVPFIGMLSSLLMWIGFVMLLKPVPINAGYFSDPKKGMALTALMGPVTNLVLAFIGMIIFRYCPYYVPYVSFVRDFLRLFMLYNVSLAVFNMIPVPPLDGSRVLFAFLPQRYYFQIMQYERYIMIAFLALVWVGALDAVVNRGVINIINFFGKITEMLPGIPL